MKKTLLLMFLLTFGVISVNADAYYVNDNGLEFTEYQYDVMCDIIGGSNVKTLTEEQYNTYEIANMTEDNHQYSTYEDNSSSNSRATNIETTYKKLSISSVCNSSYCAITTYTEWKKLPSVRSHDVIGVRLSGTSFYDSTISAFLSTGTSAISPTGSKGMSNGAGSVFKLPSGNINYITQTVKVKPQGRVFGSYQHAVKTVGYSVAYSFTISSAGLGDVFAWDSSYGTLYDEMSGVNIAL